MRMYMREPPSLHYLGGGLSLTAKRGVRPLPQKIPLPHPDPLPIEEPDTSWRTPSGEPGKLTEKITDTTK